MRLFVAAPLTDDARHALAEQISVSLPGGLPGRVVRPPNWHITLRFLGDVDEIPADRLVASLDQADLGTAFDLRWAGLGAFPRPRRATVVWVGIDRGADRLAGLASGVEASVVDAGFGPEDRPFRAHMTLSRVRPPEDVADVIDSVGPFSIGMPVDRVVLYRSHLGRGGARYEIVEEFQLG